AVNGEASVLGGTGFCESARPPGANKTKAAQSTVFRTGKSSRRVPTRTNQREGKYVQPGVIGYGGNFLHAGCVMGIGGRSMTYPHHPRSSSPDGYAVRPGSSAALTARSIDATIHPPLVRAQETVIGLVPRVAEAAAPLTSPLFLSAVALTLIFIWVAIKMRYRPSAILLSALLVMGLTSFRPAEKPLTKREIAARRPRTTLRENAPDRWTLHREQGSNYEVPQPPELPSPEYEPPTPPTYAVS